MSFDVFFQRFAHGDSVPGGGAEMRAAVAPYVVMDDPAHEFVRIAVGDGEADLYLSDDDMMANHVSGADPWEVLVAGARDAGWVIMPVDCPTCLTAESQREHLPEDLVGEVVVVATGADLARAIAWS
jgi:hypothetical protein